MTDAEAVADRDAVAGALVVTCAAFYGDRVPETFDMTLANLMADAILATLAARGWRAVPEGWQLVPESPTNGMLAQGVGYTDFILPAAIGNAPQHYLDEMRIAYRAMLSKVPAPATPPEGG